MGTSRRVGLVVGCAVAVVAAIGIVASPAGAATNPIANPGFESGLSGWSCAGTASASAGSAHSGGFALRGTPTASTIAQCTQAVAVAPNTRYVVTAWVNGSYVYIG